MGTRYGGRSSSRHVAPSWGADREVQRTVSSLTLSVVTVDALAPSTPLAVTFTQAGGTLGRDENNTMALPDKHRRVSRLHGTVSFDESGLAVLTNASTSLPIMVGDRQLDYGDKVSLADGMYVELGPYVLVAHYNTVSARAARAAQLSPNIPANPLAPSFAVDERPVPMVPDTPPAPILPQAALGGGDPFDALLAGLGEPASSGATPTAPSVGDATLARDPAVAAASATATPPVQVPRASIDPLAVLGAGAALASGESAFAPATHSVDPFADLLAAGSPSAIQSSFRAATPSSHMLTGMGEAMPPPVARAGPAPTPAFQPPAAPIIPDDFNPFDLPSEAPRNAFDPLASLAPPPSAAAQALDGGELPPVESLFPVGPPSLRDPVLDAFGAAPAAAAGDGTLESLVRVQGPVDPLAALDGTTEAPSQAPTPDHTPEFQAAFQPPRALDPLAALTGMAPSAPLPGDPFADLAQPISKAGGLHSSPPVPGSAPRMDPSTRGANPPPSAPPWPPNGATAADVSSPLPRKPPLPPAAAPDDLTRAFMEGAELAPSALPNGLTAEHMRIIGALLRSAIGGAIDMLAARATTKRELQASVTIISVEANNPLKFLPNADAALQQLLGKKMPGFMRADVAMRDAFEDLRAHEIGVIAGTRAALEEVLGKFDPGRLEARLAKGSVLDSLLPAARKSKLWDQYVALFGQVRREAEDDFQSVFGRAFVEAYERETKRLKGGG